PTPNQQNRRRPVGGVAIPFAVALCVMALPSARAGIISQCDNTAVTEGNPGIVTCTATNFGPNPVTITGVFAFAFYLAGDSSDAITSLVVLGPNPNPGNPVQFQIFFTTPPDGPEPNPDFGLW